MKTRQFIKYSGKSLLVLSFISFILLLFIGQYKMKEKPLKSIGEGEKYEILYKHSTPLIHKTYSSQFTYIRALSGLLDGANREVLRLYGITDEEINSLVKTVMEKTPAIFVHDPIRSLYQGNDQYSTYKRETLINYTKWMVENQYSTAKKLQTDLGNAQKGINNAVINQKGFNNYAKKQLLFSLTKSASSGIIVNHRLAWLFLSIGLLIIGGLIYIFGEFGGLKEGIKNNNMFRQAATNRGWIGIGIGSMMVGFYIILYFFPEYITNWILVLDPISKALNGNEASHWFFYGFLYTVAVLVMGIRMLLKYKGNNYQILRTVSVMFFQLSFAFIIPEILASLNKPGYDFKNIWPLDYDFFYGYSLNEMISSGGLGWFMLIWGIILIVIAVPVLTYFFGKRWYCSWVCGCGGLAETLGDPFRQLSNKSLKAWKVERILIHSVLIFAVINTVAVLYTYFTGSYSIVGIGTGTINGSYGFLISSMFAGVIGTGFYPLLGNRIWCRFGCPLAAYLGIVQRFKSKFRITTNGGQCISCGNCSTYCEMGIDVRWYAQRGQSIVRASCVGCGICSAVCPRGVLKLESANGSNRFVKPVLLGNESIKAES